MRDVIDGWPQYFSECYEYDVNYDGNDIRNAEAVTPDAVRLKKFYFNFLALHNLYNFLKYNNCLIMYSSAYWVMSDLYSRYAIRTISVIIKFSNICWGCNLRGRLTEATDCPDLNQYRDYLKWNDVDDSDTNVHYISSVFTTV